MSAWLACRALKLERHARTLELYRSVHGKNRAVCGALSAAGGVLGLRVRESKRGAPCAECRARSGKGDGRSVGASYAELIAWWAQSQAACTPFLGRCTGR